MSVRPQSGAAQLNRGALDGGALLMNRSSVAMLTLAAALPCLWLRGAAQVPTHIEDYLGWNRTAVSNTALDARLNEAAVHYRIYAPGPRIAMYDIAYPKDSAEALASAQYAVRVATARAQD